MVDGALAYCKELQKMDHEKVRRKVRALWSLRAEVKKRLSRTGNVEVNLTEQESRLSEMADLRVAGKGELRRRKKKTLKVSENVENAASSQALVSGVPPSSLVDDSTPASPADPFADSEYIRIAMTLFDNMDSRICADGYLSEPFKDQS